MVTDVAGICEGCGVAVRRDAPYTFRQVQGWEKVSKSGGAGPVSDRTYTGSVRCTDCGAHGVRQEKMFAR